MKMLVFDLLASIEKKLAALYCTHAGGTHLCGTHSCDAQTSASGKFMHARMSCARELSAGHVSACHADVNNTCKHEQGRASICPEELRARHDARLILEHVTGLSRAQLIIKKHLELTPEVSRRLDNILEQVSRQLPLAYALGTVPFLDLELTVRPPVLIPRVETEEWCAYVIKHIEPLIARAEIRHGADTSANLKNVHACPGAASADHKVGGECWSCPGQAGAPQNNFGQTNFVILDLCTGSGCIALALASHFAGRNVTVIGIDNAPYALDLARLNAQKNTITDCTFVLSDLYEQLPGGFVCDLIVTNPPYIALEEFNTLDRSVTLWEDRHALVAADNGLEIIRRIVALAPRYLRTLYGCGELWCEVGHMQASAVSALFEKNNFQEVRALKDINGIQRVIYGKRSLF